MIKRALGNGARRHILIAMSRPCAIIAATLIAIGFSGSAAEGGVSGDAAAPASSASASGSPALAPACPRVAVVTSARWKRRPSSDEVMAVFPARALKAHQTDVTRMSCDVSNDGRLTDCSIVRDANPGWGFDQATLSLASKFRSVPLTAYPTPAEPDCAKSDGQQPAKVTIPLSWNPGP